MSMSSPPPDNDTETGITYAALVETTDAAQDITTIYTMAVGDTFSGTVSSVAERDWVAITLTAGQTYDIDVRGAPSGAGTLSDTIMAIYDSAGIYLQGNDDGGTGTESYLSFTAATTGTYYVMARGYQANTGTYEISVQAETPPPPVSGDLDMLADYLTTGYWVDDGASPHRFDTSASNQISVNLSALTADGKQLARWALEAWEAVADIVFVETTGSARITLDDDQPGAFASYSAGGGFTSSASINISTSWLVSYGTDIGSYSFQTYMHEIGHALGLGHQGDYNGAATYGVDETFANDSWQISVMSYFTQTENTTISASRAEAVSAMISDVAAIQNLYGAAQSGTLSAGATTYGVAHTLGNSWLGQLFDAMNGTGPASVWDGDVVALTIYDTGGRDIIDFSGDTSDQNVDLRQEAVSDINGATGNLIIARGTRIEEYRAGSGNDTVQGNGRDNTLMGNDGDDTLLGAAGDDILDGGAGADTLTGGGGRDRAQYTGAGSAVTVDMRNAGANTGDAAGDSFAGIEDLSGSGFNDILRGSGGANQIWGNAGRDKLNGRGGNDTLTGGKGRDTLNGGAGDDTLQGGGARDTFVFRSGADVITDFADDRLRLDDALWGNAALSNAQILEYASEVGADVVFDFGGGNTLTLQGYSDIAALDALLSVI